MRKHLLFLIALASIAFGEVSLSLIQPALALSSSQRALLFTPQAVAAPPVGPIVTDLGACGIGSSAACPGFGGANTASITVLAPVAVGKPLIVLTADTQGSLTNTTLTDNHGNSCAEIPNADQVSVGFSVEVAWLCSVTTALSIGDVITYTNNNTITGFNTIEMSALAVVSPSYTAVDSGPPTTATGNTNGFVATWSITGAASASVPNEFWVAFTYSPNQPISSVTSSGWTNQTSNPQTGAWLVAYQVTPTTSPPTWAGNIAGPQNVNSVIFALKP
jgi:hypothetical protein